MPIIPRRYLCKKKLATIKVFLPNVWRNIILDPILFFLRKKHKTLKLTDTRMAPASAQEFPDPVIIFDLP